MRKSLLQVKTFKLLHLFYRFYKVNVVYSDKGSGKTVNELYVLYIN